MVIEIQNLQPPQSEINSEILQELDDQQLAQIQGGTPFHFVAGVAVGIAIGATATAAVGTAAAVVGAAAYYATSGFVPNPNGESSTGYPILR